VTDNAIMEMSAESLLAELGGLGPKASAPARLQLASVRVLQSMSDQVKEGKAKAGDFIITFGSDSVQEPIYTNKLRVMTIDSIAGRVMWKLKSDGSKDMSAKKPLCGSNNTEQPRIGEFFDYVGQTHMDWRRNKQGEVIEWTITDSCKDCPLKDFIPAYVFDRKTGEVEVDDKGKAVVERKSDGKPRMLKPPCSLTESHVVYLLDYGFPAIIRASSPTVRIGLKKLPDYFAEAANGQRPFIKDGQPHCVDIVTGLQEYAGNGNKTYVPQIALSEAPVELNLFGQYVALLKRYKEENIREALTSAERTEYDREETEMDDAPASAESTGAPNVGMDKETVKSKLGAKASGKSRRISKEDAADPFSDDEE
jgi:hypothetical protein